MCVRHLGKYFLAGIFLKKTNEPGLYTWCAYCTSRLIKINNNSLDAELVIVDLIGWGDAIKKKKELLAIAPLGGVVLFVDRYMHFFWLVLRFYQSI